VFEDSTAPFQAWRHLPRSDAVATRPEGVDWRSVCPISSALDVLGDKWSLLIIRDLLMHGSRTYSEFLESKERISTNILASRLSQLASLKLIERTDPHATARNNAFRLTESGAALRPVLEGLGRWAYTHLKDFHGDVVKL
jgi:DNA-binding HxlR family transcriptional regulator